MIAWTFYQQGESYTRTAPYQDGMTHDQIYQQLDGVIEANVLSPLDALHFYQYDGSICRLVSFPSQPPDLHGRVWIREDELTVLQTRDMAAELHALAAWITKRFIDAEVAAQGSVHDSVNCAFNCKSDWLKGRCSGAELARARKEVDRTGGIQLGWAVNWGYSDSQPVIPMATPSAALITGQNCRTEPNMAAYFCAAYDYRACKIELLRLWNNG